MSLTRMFFSGLLVAGGIILGAFTLHGYLDPEWQQKQQAAQAREQASDPRSVSSFQPKDRVVPSRIEPAPPEVVRSPVAKPPPKTSNPTADVKSAPKPAPPKKVAEKPVDKAKKPEPQQAAFQWPWKLFGSN